MKTTRMKSVGLLGTVSLLLISILLSLLFVTNHTSLLSRHLKNLLKHKLALD